MKKIGIFCSASENIDKMYFDSARQIGEWMGKAGKTLIYGGANLGLMECVARAVKENGGTVIGVIPAKLEEKGSVSTLLDEVIHTRNLSDRKDVITEKSEILVALPGGVGTLDEIFHVIAAASIGYHQKKVIFYNEYGFYNELLAALKTLEDKGFARQSFSTYYETANNLDELKEHYRKGGLGDVKIKRFLNNVMQEELSPIRARRAEFEKDIPEVYNILKKGSDVARETAAQTLSEVKRAMKIDYFEDQDLIRTQSERYAQK